MTNERDLRRRNRVLVSSKHDCEICERGFLSKVFFPYEGNKNFRSINSLIREIALAIISSLTIIPNLHQILSFPCQNHIAWAVATRFRRMF